MPTKPKTHKPRGQGKRVDHERWERQRQADPDLMRAKKIRDSQAWRDCRDGFKRAHPLCCDPLSRHPKQARGTEHAHHVVGLRHRPDLGLRWDNLAPLCKPCHDAIEAMERRGERTQSLFSREMIERTPERVAAMMAENAPPAKDPGGRR